MEELLKDYSFSFDKILIRKLNIEDAGSLQKLCIRCTDFYILTEGMEPNIDSGNEILADLPPDKNYSDKAVLGVFNNKNVLVAVIDIVRNFPNEGEWILGLLLIDPSERGKGLGKKLHNIIKEIATKYNAKTLRLGVVEDNHKGHGFWHSLGYYEIDRVAKRYGIKDNTVIVMRYALE
jgi:GNAT superfamily N-acetyltransferase